MLIAFALLVALTAAAANATIRVMILKGWSGFNDTEQRRRSARHASSGIRALEDLIGE
jgi:hypothetical protein